MSQEPETLSLGVGQYLLSVARHWKVVFATALIGLVGSVGFYAVWPHTATAATDINLNVITTDPFNAQKSAGGLLDITAESRIAKSYAVAVKAAALLKNSPTADRVRAASEVTTNSGTSVVQVTYTADSEAAAVRGADAVAQAYLTYRGEQAQARVQSSLDAVNKKLADARDRFTEATSRATSAAAGSADASQAQSDRQQIEIELQDLINQKNTLESVDTDGGTVLTSAEKNPTEYSPKLTYVVPAGVLLGVVVGLLISWLLDRRDSRVRTVVDIRRITNKPVYAPSSELAIRPDPADAAQLRVARELFFARIYEPSPRMLILDDSGDSAISDSTLAFAATVGRSERYTRLILPQIERRQLNELVEAIDLVPVEPAADDDAQRVAHQADDAAPMPPPATAYRSQSIASLTVFVPTDTGDEMQSDLLITRQVQRVLDTKEPGAHDLIVLTSKAGYASILAALHLMDDVVLVSRLVHSRIEGVRKVVDDAKTFDTTLVGSLVLPRPGRTK